MADLELPMPLPPSGHAEVDRDVTQTSAVTPKSTVTNGSVTVESGVTEPDEMPPPPDRDVNNMVTDMAHAMMRAAREGDDQFLYQVATHMHMIGKAHTQGTGYNSESVCEECGLGDTSWPCWPWLQAAYTGIEWLAKQAGVRL